MAEPTSIGIIGTGWVCSDGGSVVLKPHLDEMERNGLVRSADVLHEAIETVSQA